MNERLNSWKSYCSIFLCKEWMMNFKLSKWFRDEGETDNDTQRKMGKELYREGIKYRRGEPPLSLPL